jgi:hypothetical protein
MDPNSYGDPCCTLYGRDVTVVFAPVAHIGYVADRQELLHGVARALGPWYAFSDGTKAAGVLKLDLDLTTGKARHAHIVSSVLEKLRSPFDSNESLRAFFERALVSNVTFSACGPSTTKTNVELTIQFSLTP